MKLAVIGLGYVGLSTAAGFAEKGNKIIGIDIDKEKIDKLKKGICPIYEQGLSEILKKHFTNGSILFSHEVQNISEADILFIAVGTPPKKNGEPNLSYIESVGKDIAPYLKESHIVVIKSTVPPDTYLRLEKIIYSERRKSKLDDIKINIAVNPEFLREGYALYDTLNPVRIIIGTESEYAKNKLTAFYSSFHAPLFITDPVSATLIKYASNSFLATKISFINEMAQICERLGGDVSDVAKGMGMDPRIGDKFLGAGIGYGGSCFPKDTKGLLYIAKDVGYDFKIVKSTIEVNAKQYKIVIKKLKKNLGRLRGRTIGVLGLAFKENTDDIRESISIKIIKELLNSYAIIQVHDFKAINNTKQILNNIQYFEDPYKVAENADAIIIATEWSEYKKLDWIRVRDLMKKPLIVDGRNLLDCEKMEEYGFIYESIGRRS